MNKFGRYVGQGTSVPAIMERQTGSEASIMTLGYSNTRKDVPLSEFVIEGGSDPMVFFFDSVDVFETEVAEDMGITVTGDEIAIPAGVVIHPVGAVDIGSKYIQLNNGAVRGRNAGIDGIISTNTGGVVRSSAGQIVLTDFFVVAPAGPGIKISGSKANGDIAKLIMVGVFSSPVGFDITGFSVPSLTNCFVGQMDGMPAPAVGVRFSGAADKSHVLNTPLFDCTTAAIEFAADANFDYADIAGNFYTAGTPFLRGVAGYTLNVAGEVTRNKSLGGLASTASTLDGIDQFDPQWNFQSNPSIPDSKALGAWYQTAGEEITAITTQNEYVKANITSASPTIIQRFTADGTGTLTYTGVRPRTAQVTVTGVVSTTNNQEVEVGIYKDGTLIPDSTTTVRVGTGQDKRAFTGTALVLLEQPGWHDPVVPNCTIEIYVRNITGTDDITISDLDVTVFSD